MERKRKKENRRSHMRNRLLCYLLSGALALTNLAIMPTLTVSAAGLSEQDNGNQEELQPNVVVSNYDELVQAIDESENGDIIGIDRIISICNDEDYLGAADKHITILKMSYNAYFEIAQSVRLTIRNLTFDGNRSKFNTRNTNPMLSANSNIIFQNVIIQNCYSQSGGAGLCVYSGVINTHNCIFRDNHAIDGGHIKVFNTSTVNIRNTELTKGEANSDGGAIYISGETATVNFVNSKIYGNQATGVGGGIKNNGKTFLKDTIIYGNTADCGADIANTMYAKFQIEEMDKLVKIYESASLLPKSWIVDFDTDNRMPPHLIDLSQDYALVKLDYEEIPEEEKPDDTLENEETKGDGNKEDSGGDNPVVDNNDENNTGDVTAPDNDNTSDSNSEQSKPEEGTVADSDSNKSNDNKENGSTENNENQENKENKQENQGNVGDTENNENKDGSSFDSNLNDTEHSNANMPDTSIGNGNQTSNPSVEKPNVDNEGSASDSKTPSSEGNKQPDSTVNNGNQGGSSAGDMGNNSDNNNQNQTNTPVSGVANNTTNGNASGNTNSGSDSSTGNSNINTGVSQNGGNESSKPENNQDNNSGSSDNGGTVAITGDSQTSASDTNKDDSENKNVVKRKKAIKKLTVTAKRGKGKISGKTLKKATIKIKIGKKTYKVKSNAKGKFTVKLKGKAKLKKGQKVKVIVSKKGYKTKSKIFKVK